MKIFRYLLGIASFLIVWVLSAIVVGIAIAIVFPPPEGETVVVGWGLDWRNIPGTVLGIFAGVQSFRRAVREPKGKVQAPPV